MVEPNDQTFDMIMNGGFGMGTVCLPIYLPRMIITIIFPPLGIILEQNEKGWPEPTKIITSIILTSCFYFPGLIHALYGLDCSNMSKK